ncbi:MAG: PilZ domain-containing protein [Gemmatimonadetes bacterium]|nr:PilZ domain-containing protein [Gemmatimonadota bacterium]
MSSFEIGDVHVATDGESLTLSRDGEPVVELRLDSDGLSELLDFLRSVRVTRFNRRRGFHVPIVVDDFKVRLGGDLSHLDARPRDVSLSGIFLEFPPGATPQLEVGDEVEVSVALASYASTMNGIVRRRTEDGLGIEFSHAADTRAPTPPSDLSRIVMRLEREWLSARLDR